MRIERLKKEYEVDIHWRAFPLHPETPEEGTPLEQLFPHVSSEDLKMMKERVKKTADELGLPFVDRAKTYNSRLAQELGKWAERNNRGDPFHHAVFSAYFAEGINIAKIPALIKIAASVGLPRKEAEEVLTKRTFKAEVDEDRSRSRKNGITAVPTFVMNNSRMIGAQPYEMLKEFVKAKGIKKRKDQ